MIQSPVISIIMPAFNSAAFIGISINSVIEQSFSDWELLVIDDCSDDETIKIIDNFSLSDDRIKLLKMPRNSGPALTRNFGLAHSSGKYVAFLDSDDIWLPDKLKLQLSFMESGAFDFTY